MPGRRFILDSDDEDDGDQEEATQVMLSQQSLHRNTNGPNSPIIDLTNSPCCAADVSLENLSSTSSTGNPNIKILNFILTYGCFSIVNLQRQIQDAHNRLLESSSMSTNSLPSADHPVSQPSTMSGFRRRQTTMGAIGSEKKKPLKTYGSRTTLDDLGLRSSGDQVDWEVSLTKKRRIANNETDVKVVAALPGAKIKPTAAGAPVTEGRFGSQQDNLGAFVQASSTQSSVRNDTDGTEMYSSLQESKGRTVPAHKSPSSGSRGHPRDRSSAHDNGDGLDGQAAAIEQEGEIYSSNSLPMGTNLYDESHLTVSTQSSMLLPVSTLAPTLLPPAHRFKGVDVITPNTGDHPNEHRSLFETMSKPTVLITLEKEREPSLDDLKTEDFLLHSNSAKHEQNSETSSQLLAENSISRDLPPKSEQTHLDQHQPAAKSKPRKTSVDGPDELSLPTSRPFDENLFCEASKAKSKRKKLDQDELGSDEVDIGLPKENYQPRPSRSRSNRAMDDLVLAIDFSKKPESLLKAKKNKRRKTMGDEIKVLEDVDKSVIHPENRGISGKEYYPITHDHNKTQRTNVPIETVAEVLEPIATKQREEIIGYTNEHQEPTLEKSKTIADTIGATAVASEPKKRRGRPKKQAMEQAEDAGTDATSDKLLRPTIDSDDNQDVMQALPTKKSRKRKVEESLPGIIEQLVASTSEDHLGDSLSRQALSEVQGRANMSAPSSKPGEFSKEKKEVTPAPVAAAPLQTPQKQERKGSDKHSPINSGKVPHRVGLSKRARIEPLLRIVKK